jgi:SAM-dependent methyltransferase
MRESAPGQALGDAPLLYDSWDTLVPPRGLWVGPNDPFVHFVRWPLEYRVYLPLLANLGSDGSVLEIGCHHGRTMLGLVDYLKPPGRYAGFDIMPAQIAFAQQHIQARYPHCTFTLADVHSAVYQPAGRLRPEDYRFPYDDASFDCVYAASVFTHLTPGATANYLRESRRVITSRGRCVFSFFVLDYYQDRGATRYEFDHPLPGHSGVAVRDPQNPENRIAYDTGTITRLATDAGWEVERIVPGYWSNRGGVSVNEHELVILRPL